MPGKMVVGRSIVYTRVPIPITSREEFITRCWNQKVWPAEVLRSSRERLWPFDNYSIATLSHVTDPA